MRKTKSRQNNKQKNTSHSLGNLTSRIGRNSHFLVDVCIWMIDHLPNKLPATKSLSQALLWGKLNKDGHHTHFCSTPLAPEEALQTKSWIWDCLAYHVIPGPGHCLCYLSPSSYPSSPGVCWSSQADPWLLSPFLSMPHPRTTCLDGLLLIEFLLAFSGLELFLLGSSTLLHAGAVPLGSRQPDSRNGLFWVGATYLFVLMAPEICTPHPSGPRDPKSGVYQAPLNVLDRNRPHWGERARAQPEARTCGERTFIVCQH